jgi:formiminotetrahydrofolate cyclodeaminase
VSDGGPPLGAEPIQGFLDRLASDAPTPGGGAVAALCGAAGGALVAMVCRLTIGREAYQEVESTMRRDLAHADLARAAFLELAEGDAAAFEDVMSAFRLPKDDDRRRAERSAAIQRAYEAAARVPLEIARRAVELLEVAGRSTELGNANAASDGLSAAHVLHAAAHAALANVEINAAALKDEATAAELGAESRSLAERADALLVRARAAFAARLG